MAKYKFTIGKVVNKLKLFGVVSHCCTWMGNGVLVAKAWGCPPPKNEEDAKKLCYSFWSNKEIKGLEPVSIVAQPLDRDDKKAFYRSDAWKKLRYRVLLENDGRCELCGRSKEHGVVLHVDHIKPIHDYPALRFDPKNLQVLCEDCNLGKSNLDETDWRRKKC